MYRMKASIVLVLVLPLLSIEYDLRCPVSSEWYFVAKTRCVVSTNYYICLFDEWNIVYSESCHGELSAKTGRKIVKSLSLNEVDCAPSRYQPFIFTTNGNSECVYSKSLCSEEGQVISSNGTTTEDVGCRCDYTKGYTYTSTPENVCSCIPSKEDCSCYIKPCPDDKKLNADYICVDKSHVSFPAIISSPSYGIGKTTSSAEWLTDNMSETRTSAGDAVVGIIVIVLIYVVILTVLFVEVRPYLIRTEVQYREDLIVDKCDESLKFTLIPGGDLTIEWEVESWLPVKSIVFQKEGANMQLNNKYIWQLSKERRKQSLTIESDDAGTYITTCDIQKNGENIQLDNNKYILKYNDGKQLSLTINKCDPGDAGTYTCIATNVLRLSNNGVERCVHQLKTETEVDFRKFLMNFPICRLAIINPFQLNVTNLATETQDIVLTKGVNLKLEIGRNQNIAIIKWFRRDSNNITSLPFKDKPDKYSGGTITEPSLWINSSQMDDAGHYVCVVKYVNNDILTFVFYLQDKMYEEIRNHREDKLYVKTSTVDKAYQCLSTHGMVVITGRKGTGKTKMSLELVSLCEKAGVQPLRVELSNGDFEKCNTEKLLYIIDNVRFEPVDLGKLKKIVSLLSYPKHHLVITCSSENVASLKDVLKHSDMFNEECIMDLNDSLTQQDKTFILGTYFKAKNITQTSLQESNYRSKDILSGNIPVTIDTETTEKIIKSNPYYGFPLTVKQFCGDRKRLYSGERYFTNPPKELLEKVKEIYQKGIDGNADKTREIHQYCILVHISIYEHLKIDDFKVPLYEKTAKELFGYELGTDIMKDIQNAADSMCGVFVECQAKNYKFIHPCMAKVVFMSSDYCAKNYLIISGSFQDTKDYVRSYKYEPAENESVYKLTCDLYLELCDRLIFESCENIELSKEVYRYMYTEFIKLHDSTFLNVLIKKLDEFKLVGSLPVWQIITMLDGLTNYGIDPWIYANKDSNETFQKYPYVQCGLIAACRSEYLNRGAENVLTSLLFNKCLKDQTFVESLGRSLDINGNTFFHYLTLFGKEESCCILGIDERLSKENRDIFDKPNKLGVSPIEMAAFMGKCNVFKLLYVKTSKQVLGLAVLKEGTNKIKNKCLNTIAKNGMNYFLGSGQSSVELDITVNFESNVLSSATCGRKEDYLAIIAFLQQSPVAIKKFVTSERKANKKKRT